MSAPIERLTWELFCPFPGLLASAEFTYADRNRKTSARVSRIRGGSYTAKKYVEAMEVSYLDVGSDDYLIFRHLHHERDGDDPGGRVVLSYPHYPRFLLGLQNVVPTFADGCFEQREDGFIVTEHGLNTRVLVEDLIRGGTLSFHPAVIVPRDTDQESDDAPIAAGEPGVRLYVNGGDYWTETSLDTFLAFQHFYERFDLFQLAAQAMLLAAASGGEAARASAPRVSAPQPVRSVAKSLMGPKKKAV